MGRFTGLIIVMLVIAFLLRVDFIFYVIYVCVFIYAWSRWQTPRSLKKLTTERLFARNTFNGEDVAITVRLHNQSRLPMPWVQINESIPVELAIESSVSQAISLGGNETAVFTYQLKGRRRGYYYRSRSAG